jgi:hypothetical protein
MRKALVPVLFCLLAGCASVGGNPDGATQQTCQQDSDCPLQDGGGCDSQCITPENHYTCIGGYCCCACVCNS